MAAILARVELTRKKLAERAGIGRSTLISWEDENPDNRRNPSPATLRKVADAIDVHIEECREVVKEVRREADRRDPNAKPATASKRRRASSPPDPQKEEE